MLKDNFVGLTKLIDKINQFLIDENAIITIDLVGSASKATNN
jgi:hypothetical protein